MTAPSIRILAAWLCLVTCPFGGLAPGRGYVLCLGMDGHVAVGPPEVGCDDCEPSSARPQDAPCPDDQGLIDASCCPCLDIPIISPGENPLPKTSARASSTLPGPALAMPPPPQWGAGGWMPPRSPAYHAPPDAPHSVLPQLRSVILVI